VSVFEKGIAIWFVAIAAGGAWLYATSSDRQAKAAAKIEIPQLPTSPQTKPPNIPEHVQAACMSIVRGRVPSGTSVKDISITYDFSLRQTRDSRGRLDFETIHSISDNVEDSNYYDVMVQAEIAGKRFGSSYRCHQHAGTVEIVR
jgi:hypothetical protein